MDGQLVDYIDQHGQLSNEHIRSLANNIKTGLSESALDIYSVKQLFRFRKGIGKRNEILINDDLFEFSFDDHLVFSIAVKGTDFYCIGEASILLEYLYDPHMLAKTIVSERNRASKLYDEYCKGLTRVAS